MAKLNRHECKLGTKGFRGRRVNRGDLHVYVGAVELVDFGDGPVWQSIRNGFVHSTDFAYSTKLEARREIDPDARTMGSRTIADRN
jgi:hypothetical protein